MRNFLGRLRIGGESFEGPNATYTRGWNGLDVAVGVHGEDFHKIIRDRASHMNAEDATAIYASLELPSIADLVADLLGVKRNAMRSLGREELRARACALSKDEAPAFVEAARLARAVAWLAGVHWGVIGKNLVEPVASLSPEQREKLGVAPTGGVSGTGLEHTDRLRAERLTHPLAGPGLKSLEGGAP